MNKPLELHPDVAEFARALRRLEAFLRKYDHLANWAAWMADCADEVERSDVNGLRRFYGAFGGMGSFNDIGISIPGTWTPDWKANKQLCDLSDHAYACAEKLGKRPPNDARHTLTQSGVWLYGTRDTN